MEARTNQAFCVRRVWRDAEGELAADTLGLLAHFWVAGDAAQGYAARKLTELSGNLKDELPTALKMAQEHYRQRVHFQTADHLGKLTHELSLPPYRIMWVSPFLNNDKL